MSAQAEEGTLRRMTLGDIAMARRVFGDSIVYSRVWIHCDSYLPFGLQKQNYAMTPNGELWYRKSMYREDFSANSVFIEDKYVFIHELGHVWQHQHGQWVRVRGLLAGLLNIPTSWIKKSSLITLLNSKPLFWLITGYCWFMVSVSGLTIRDQGAWGCTGALICCRMSPRFIRKS